MIETVKAAVVASIIGPGDNVQAIASTVGGRLARTITDTSRVGPSVIDAIAHVASSAICSPVRAGVDLSHATKGIVVGVLRGTALASAEARDTISHTAHVAIRATAQVGGDLEVAATGLVQGAIAGTKESGVSAEDAAAAAASGALKAAGEVSSRALATVRNALIKTSQGVKVVTRELEAALLSNN